MSRHGSAVMSERLQSIGNASVELTRFENFDADKRSFDVITFVANIHHLPLRESLFRARQMLRPGGELAIVGLSANKTIADWPWAVLCTPVACVGSQAASRDSQHRRGRC
jgi:2-polyprenyl-3-methyl-5-hydroxy-6-metoxy-1,4-benzoquinol methylase